MTNHNIIFHYTTISGLIGIIKMHELWASDCRFLNDGTEIIYAQKIFFDEVQKLDLAPYRYLSGRCKLPGASLSQFRMFLTCFCEEGDLLSQWRGYGMDQGYALGFDMKQLESLKIGEICPVQYGISNPAEYFSKELASVKEPTAHPAVEEFHASMWIMPRLARIKNPSFCEEREWRLLIQYPKYETPVKIETIQFRESSMGPIPYLPVSFPPESLRQVIIGPGNHIETRQEAVCYMLSHFGYSDIVIKKSKIPLRK